jgi:hypothetical protein
VGWYNPQTPRRGQGLKVHKIKRRRGRITVVGLISHGEYIPENISQTH